MSCQRDARLASAGHALDPRVGPFYRVVVATPPSPVVGNLIRGGNRGSGANWVTDAGPLVQKSIQFGKPVVVVSIK